MINEVNAELGNDTAEVANLQSLFNQLRMSTRGHEVLNAETDLLIPKEGLESELNVTPEYKVAVKVMSYLQEKIDCLTRERICRVPVGSTWAAT